jgi:hypothetical protein
MKKYDEDLNTTLIFVSPVWCSGARVLTPLQAGLFSAVTSAFIIEANSELKPDPGDETAALLLTGQWRPQRPQRSDIRRRLAKVWSTLCCTLRPSTLYDHTFPWYLGVAGETAVSPP